jgi:hypothetical protein
MEKCLSTSGTCEDEAKERTNISIKDVSMLRQSNENDRL